MARESCFQGCGDMHLRRWTLEPGKGSHYLGLPYIPYTVKYGPVAIDINRSVGLGYRMLSGLFAILNESIRGPN